MAPKPVLYLFLHSMVSLCNNILSLIACAVKTASLKYSVDP